MFRLTLLLFCSEQLFDCLALLYNSLSQRINMMTCLNRHHPEESAAGNSSTYQCIASTWSLLITSDTHTQPHTRPSVRLSIQAHGGLLKYQTCMCQGENSATLEATSATPGALPDQ